jgi:hypothetical protein
MSELEAGAIVRLPGDAFLLSVGTTTLLVDPGAGLDAPDGCVVDHVLFFFFFFFFFNQKKKKLNGFSGKD